jgi:hypothetical protein
MELTLSREPPEKLKIEDGGQIFIMIFTTAVCIGHGRQFHGCFSVCYVLYLIGKNFLTDRRHGPMHHDQRLKI